MIDMCIYDRCIIGIIYIHMINEDCIYIYIHLQFSHPSLLFNQPKHRAGRSLRVVLAAMLRPPRGPVRRCYDVAMVGLPIGGKWMGKMISGNFM